MEHALKIKGGDHVQLRDGSALVGVVTNKTFLIQPRFTKKPLKIKRKNIVWILAGSKKGISEDRMTLLDGSELRGSIKSPTVNLQSDEMGAVEVPFAEVLAVQLLMELF